MKKYLSLILCACFILSVLAGCRRLKSDGSSAYSIVEQTVYVTESADEETKQESEQSPQQTEQQQHYYISTVIAPYEVVFYKDGMQSVSTDKELNLKIAQHIEQWYKYRKSIACCNLAATTDLIRKMRQNETAIELHFDDEIKFYGGVISSNTRTLFISLTGEYDNLLFSNTMQSPDYWGGPIGTNGGTGLEQYFDYVQFTPLTEEEKRWRSTITTPSIEFYRYGELICDTGAYFSDYQFNYEIAQHIESWFYHKDEIPTIETGIQDKTLTNIRDKETYIELWFGGGTTIYGKQIFSDDSCYLIIPLTGEYAYCIFEGTYDEFSSVAYMPDGDGLEQYFDRLKEFER